MEVKVSSDELLILGVGMQIPTLTVSYTNPKLDSQLRRSERLTPAHISLFMLTSILQYPLVARHTLCYLLYPVLNTYA